jgi:hypothetical protein
MCSGAAAFQPARQAPFWDGPLHPRFGQVRLDAVTVGQSNRTLRETRASRV